jgi:hypothetical protein
MTALLDALLDLLEGWRAVFPQKRTFGRALRLALAQVLAPGCRTISRIIAACGRDQRDWSADYRVFSRSPWQQEQLFQVPITAGLEHFAQRDHIAVAGDFTHLVKTGRRIPNVRCMRDPMSPPFHANLVHGLRFVQYTLLLPLYENAENDADDGQDGTPPRSVPVCFREVPVPAKPGKKATDEERAAYKAKQRQRPASRMALEALVRLRADFDAAGAADKDVIAALDGGFCNKVFFGSKLERIELVARARKDAKLCFAAGAGGRCFYAQEKFTPESVRADESRPWKTGRFFHGGAWRTMRYKEVWGVFWANGAGRRVLRLIVLASTPYRNSPNSRVNYRQPAYLLTTDVKRPVETLIQCYLDRWQIEVNHREEKSVFGVGDAQVRNPKSVPRQPAFVVAIYAMMLLAAQNAYGGTRTAAYVPLPKWRKGAKRPSCQDIVNELRREMEAEPQKLRDFASQTAVMAAAIPRRRLNPPGNGQTNWK